MIKKIRLGDTESDTGSVSCIVFCFRYDTVSGQSNIRFLAAWVILFYANGNRNLNFTRSGKAFEKLILLIFSVFL